MLLLLLLLLSVSTLPASRHSPEEVRAVKCVFLFHTPVSVSHTYASWCLGSTAASVALAVSEEVFHEAFVKVNIVGVLPFFATESLVFALRYALLSTMKWIFRSKTSPSDLNLAYLDLCSPCWTDGLCPGCVE